MKLVGTALALVFGLVSVAIAGAPYTNTAFGYRLECPGGWAAQGDAAAATVMLALAEGPMRAKISAAERAGAVTDEVGERMRVRDEATLGQRTARWKRVPFAAPAPGSAAGARWAFAYRKPGGAAEISVASLFSYPQATGRHVWVKMQLVAPIERAREAGNQMRALLAAFAPGTASAPAASPSATVVGKSGAADAMLLDETGELARVTFEAAPLQAELVQYQKDLFQPTVAMEARLARLFDDVTVRADRKELTEVGKISAFREIVGRYKKMLEPLEASVPTNADLAKAHHGVVGFYRERAAIYERIVESTASKDSPGVAKAAQQLSTHDFQTTPAYQQLTALAAMPSEEPLPPQAPAEPARQP